MHIVLVTSDAPYLGGAATWAPLIAQNPDWTYRVVDLLECGHAKDLRGAIRDAIAAQIQTADAVVAHGAAAPMAVEAVAAVRPAMPVLLLAPRMITNDHVIVKVLRTVFAKATPLLRAIVRHKRRRLLVDVRFLKKQLRYLMPEHAITPAIIVEAQKALADPRFDPFLDRTAEMVVTNILTPVRQSVLDAVPNRTVIGQLGSPMLEKPEETAAALRQVLNS